ncbi:hypothetical protein [Enterovibrio paralichthyis]|uniref:hypothetical protein n=1 Tax=Enterovibrio paralichthyis TaxID=2853805 RepID=UPI001C45756A|nr:hypothetical protein [Enterovibrio paralichthyis]MBV7300194.1 hypothetical protein [Enterovibrio paralichthyis]
MNFEEKLLHALSEEGSSRKELSCSKSYFELAIEALELNDFDTFIKYMNLFLSDKNTNTRKKKKAKEILDLVIKEYENNKRVVYQYISADINFILYGSEGKKHQGLGM